MTYRSSVVFLLVVSPGTLVLAGCSSGKKSFTLKGSVSYQEKPLPSGLVRIHMTDNRVAMAMIQPDGSFEMTDVFPGEAKVTIEEDPDAKMQRMMPPAPQVKMGPFAKAPTPTVSLPAKYKDVNTSGLVFTLAPGQPLNIELR